MPKRLGAVFALAVALRLALCLVNAQANDDHMTPIYKIAETGALPQVHECFECYQPKLFYLAGAGLLRVLRLDEGVGAIKAIQGLDFLLGIGTLWILALFLRALPWTEAERLSAFALVALNPYLVAAHAQASNDALVILLGAGFLYQLRLFLTGAGNSRRHLGWAALCMVLAGVTKASGLVLFVGGALLLSARLLSGRRRRERAADLAIFVAAFAVFVPYFGGYVSNYVQFGWPFVTNMPMDPMPHFFLETFPARPGITSIFNSYFSFYFLLLLRRPMLNLSVTSAPYHQTSFWTLLYGTTHCLNYYQWPPSWRSPTNAMALLARAIFVLALVPTVLLIFGALESLSRLLASLRRSGARALLGLEGSALIFAGGFVSFLILYSLRHRDFASVKAVYVYPGLLAFVVLFRQGYALLRGHARLRAGADAAIAALCALYLADVGSVIVRLARR
jgi:hypothetical protein